MAIGNDFEVQPSLENGQSRLEYKGVSIDPVELYEIYERSEHGSYHAEQPLRYSQLYGYEPRSQFLDDLGIDVHPVGHMLYTYRDITVPFLEQQRESDELQFSEEEEAELSVAAVLHDLGECTHDEIQQKLGFTVGDLPYGTYHLDQKIKEKAVRGFLFDKYFSSDVPSDLLRRVDEIDLKETTDPSVAAFEVIERTGYYITSRRAAGVVIAEKNDYTPGDERIAQLGRLATIVGANHRPYLEENRKRFPFVDLVLETIK